MSRTHGASDELSPNKSHRRRTKFGSDVARRARFRPFDDGAAGLVPSTAIIECLEQRRLLTQPNLTLAVASLLYFPGNDVTVVQEGATLELDGNRKVDSATLILQTPGNQDPGVLELANYTGAIMATQEQGGRKLLLKAPTIGASTAEMIEALEHVQFKDTAIDFTIVPSSVQITVTALTAPEGESPTSDPDSVTINCARVVAAPSPFDDPFGYREGDSAKAITTSATVSQRGLSSFDGWTLTASITSSPRDANETLGVANGNPPAGNPIKYTGSLAVGTKIRHNSTEIGTVTADGTGQDGQLSVKLNSMATQMRVEDLIRALTYENESVDPNTTASVQISLDNDLNKDGAANDTRQIAITPVNSPPIRTGQLPAPVFAEDAPGLTSDPGLSLGLQTVSYTPGDTLPIDLQLYPDPANRPTQQSIRIIVTRVPDFDQFGNPTVVGINPMTGLEEVQGVVEGASLTLGQLQQAKFKARANVNNDGVSASLRTFAFRVVDDGGTALGGSNTLLDQSFVISITPVNDPPTIASVSDLTVAQDASNLGVDLTGITAGPINESGQTLKVSAEDISNSGLFESLTVVPIANQPTRRRLAFTLNPDSPINPVKDKQATVKVTVNDGGEVNAEVSDTFTIFVNRRPTTENGSISQNVSMRSFEIDLTDRVSDIETLDEDLTYNITTQPDSKVGTLTELGHGWDPLESTCRHASLSIL